MSELNGIPLSKNSARLMFLPISHLMKHTLMACDLDEIENEQFRKEYAEDIWSPEKARNMFRPMWMSGIPMVRKEHRIVITDAV